LAFVATLPSARPAAVNAGATFVADLGFYPGNPRQAGNPIGATCLAMIEQVVVKLAVAIDLATFLPHLSERINLPLVFARTLAQWRLEPSIEAATMDAQQAANRPHRKPLLMLGNERTSLCIPGEIRGRFP
jgi:hypothetical protein